MMPINAYPVLFWYTRQPVTNCKCFRAKKLEMMYLELSTNIIYQN